MIGWIKAIIGVAVKVFGFIKTAGHPVDPLAEALPFALAQILPAVKNAIAFQGYDTVAKFDAWLVTIDMTTGTDAGAIDLIPRMPAKIEEEFFDAAVKMARCYGYMLLKVDGYYEA